MPLNKTTTKAYLEAVAELVDKWVEILGLSHWHIVIHGEEEGEESPRQMSVNWQPGYKRVLFVVNTSISFPEVNLQSEVVERTVIHELCHLLLSPVHNLFHQELEAEGLLWGLYRTANEEATELVAASIWNLYKGATNAKTTKQSGRAGVRSRANAKLAAISKAGGRAAAGG